MRCFFGEIALSGAIRPIGQAGLRLKEAAKLGLKEAVIAAATELPGKTGITSRPIEDVAGLAAWIAGLSAHE